MGCVSPNVVFVRCVATPFEAAVVSLLDKKVHILSGAQVQATGVLLGESSDSTGLPGGPGWVKVMDIRPVCNIIPYKYGRHEIDRDPHSRM